MAENISFSIPSILLIQQQNLLRLIFSYLIKTRYFIYSLDNVNFYTCLSCLKRIFCPFLEKNIIHSFMTDFAI